MPTPMVLGENSKLKSRNRKAANNESTKIKNGLKVSENTKMPNREKARIYTSPDSPLR